MNLLLDTHVVLWWLAADPALSDDLRSLLDSEPEVYVSPTSLWEIAIKQTIGKLPDVPDLLERVRDSGFRGLPVTHEHALAAGRLPLIHHDPFDRMLIAQARCESLVLATRDAAIQKYEVTVLVA